MVKVKKKTKTPVYKGFPCHEAPRGCEKRSWYMKRNWKGEDETHWCAAHFEKHVMEPRSKQRALDVARIKKSASTKKKRVVKRAKSS